MFPAIYENVTGIVRLNEVKTGEFKGKHPSGITIHYTASDSLAPTVEYLESKNLGYHILIDKAGKVHQTVDFHSTCHHAGKALWKGNSPNRTHIAVALLSWGPLEETDSPKFFKSWSGKLIHATETVFKNGSYWDGATDAQMNQLRVFLKWCVQFGINPEHVCGHSECCIPAGRKIDPGGVIDDLHMLRNYLKAYVVKSLN